MTRLTQKRIKQLGATKYITSRIVNKLTPIEVRGRQKFYAIADVLKSIEEYANLPRIRKKTRSLLYELIKKVSELNTITTVGDTLYELERELRDALIDIKKTFAEGHRSDREYEKEKRKSERHRFNYRRKKAEKEKLPLLVPVGKIIPIKFRNIPN